MFYIVGVAFAVVVAVLAILDQRTRRKYRARDARRHERQRIRIRDWTVWEWVYGRRTSLRISHRPEAVED